MRLGVEIIQRISGNFIRIPAMNPLRFSNLDRGLAHLIDTIEIRLDFQLVLTDCLDAAFDFPYSACTAR
jgi:hypothetical protein